MDTCPVCGNADFVNQDGHYYCFECGTQSQEIRDEIVDDDDLTMNDFSNFQKISGKKGVKRKYDNLVADGDEDDITFHECWQRIFQSLLRVMIDQLGFSPSLEESGKLVWFLYLKNAFKIHLDTFDFVDSFEKNARLVLSKQTQSKKGSRATPIDHGLFLKKKAFSKRRLVTLLFFSSFLSDQFIPLHELLSLFCSGKLRLPFDASQVKSKAMLSILEDYYRNELSLQTVGFYRLVDMVRNVIQVPQNKFPVDLVALGSSFLEKMLLPDSLCPLLKRLQLICHDVNMTPLFSVHRYYGPLSVRVMGVVIVLLKMIYRLDDKYEHEQSEAAVSIDQSEVDKSNAVYTWKAWVAMVTTHHYTTVQSSCQPSYQDIHHLDDPSSYLRHCIDVSFKHDKKNAKKGFLLLEEKLKGSYSSYLMNKRARRYPRQVKQEWDPAETGSCDVTGTSSQLHQPENPRWLFQTFEDKVTAIDSSKPVKPVWFPLNLALPHLGGCGYECYHPLPQSLNKESTQHISIADVGVSASQLFLLKFAAGLINVPVAILAARVVDVEHVLRYQGFLSTATQKVFRTATVHAKQ